MCIKVNIVRSRSDVPNEHMAHNIALPLAKAFTTHNLSMYNHDVCVIDLLLSAQGCFQTCASRTVRVYPPKCRCTELYQISVTRHQHIELLCHLLFQYLLFHRHMAHMSHILHHSLSSSHYTKRKRSDDINISFCHVFSAFYYRRTCCTSSLIVTLFGLVFSVLAIETSSKQLVLGKLQSGATYKITLSPFLWRVGVRFDGGCSRGKGFVHVVLTHCDHTSFNKGGGSSTCQLLKTAPPRSSTAHAQIPPLTPTLLTSR